MGRKSKNVVFQVLFLLLVATTPAWALEPSKVAVLDLESADQDPQNITYLTDAIYNGVTPLPASGFAVISGEKSRSILSSKGFDPSKCEESCNIEAGKMLEVDYLFSGKSRHFDEQMEVVIKLHEIESGRLIGQKRCEAKTLSALSKEVEKATTQLAERLSEIDASPKKEAPPKEEEEPSKDDKDDDKILVEFQSEPKGAHVFVDNGHVCHSTPCSSRVSPGIYEIAMTKKYHHRRTKTVEITKEEKVKLELKKASYSYFGMDDTSWGGYLLTGGIAPHDSDYKKISVLDGYGFANLHKWVDVGGGGGIFSYHYSTRGANWSIFKFGPAVRVGRFIIHSQVNLLSFRHKSKTESKGWLPGLTTYATFPVLNNRELKGWGRLIPAFSGGVDVWFNDDLKHDQTGYWIGISWLGHFSF